ncbi:hypothetical protein [Winogradskyella sp. PE311]|uniref:hypothetical protein n=1 Tax=Winogradskyella sp. PE311 TaxID=3366943 RepID=UPI003980D9A9
MSKPKGLISAAEAKTLNDAYTKRCTLISNNITKRPDNRSSWYSLEDIKSFIQHAEKQAKELKYDLNGFRVYCGAYPDKEGVEGYSTSFIVPTTSGKTGEAADGNGDGHDLPGADGLNKGHSGVPPNANYPQ